MAEWDVELTKDLVTELGIGIPAAEFHHLTDMGRGGWSDSTEGTLGTAGRGSHAWCRTVPAGRWSQPDLLLG